jgi:flavin-dependent amine oxidoreductase
MLIGFSLRSNPWLPSSTPFGIVGLNLIPLVAIGRLSAQEDLARPVERTLFFAGEATNSDGHHGTVHGAIATGRRAAREVLESLREA